MDGWMDGSDLCHVSFPSFTCIASDRQIDYLTGSRRSDIFDIINLWICRLNISIYFEHCSFSLSVLVTPSQPNYICIDQCMYMYLMSPSFMDGTKQVICNRDMCSGQVGIQVIKTKKQGKIVRRRRKVAFILFIISRCCLIIEGFSPISSFSPLFYAASWMISWLSCTSWLIYLEPCALLQFLLFQRLIVIYIL